MTQLRKMIKESFFSEVLSISGGTLAGLFLASSAMQNLLENFPGLLIMIPGFFGLRGNILGALSARIGTGLHTGLIEPKITLKGATAMNLIASLLLSTFVNTLIGFLTYFASIILGMNAVLWKLMAVGALSGALASIIVGPFTIILPIFVFRKGIDPDSVMGPLVTSVGDITAVICLFLAAILVG
ncbi:magnesium transporter, partial [Candidatus Bathyarchaeota archaeon]|nr:magnesium transporter [Candidatus Bathyarchaeota archaeon]